MVKKFDGMHNKESKYSVPEDTTMLNGVGFNHPAHNIKTSSHTDLVMGTYKLTQRTSDTSLPNDSLQHICTDAEVSNRDLIEMR